jgi:hypothetical protein
MMIHSDVRVAQAADRHRQLLASARRRPSGTDQPNRVSRWLTSVMNRGQLQSITPVDPKVAPAEPSLAAWISSRQRRLDPTC